MHTFPRALMWAARASLFQNANPSPPRVHVTTFATEPCTDVL